MKMCDVSLSLYSSLQLSNSLSLSPLNCKTLIGWAAEYLLSSSFFFFFFLGTNLYSLTLFCFLSVFWLYLSFILFVAFACGLVTQCVLVRY